MNKLLRLVLLVLAMLFSAYIFAAPTANSLCCDEKQNTTQCIEENAYQLTKNNDSLIILSDVGDICGKDCIDWP